MSNERIRIMAKEKRVKLWQIAEKLRIPDFAFSKMLRRELPEVERVRVEKIILEIAEEHKYAEVTAEE